MQIRVVYLPVRDRFTIQTKWEFFGIHMPLWTRISAVDNRYYDYNRECIFSDQTEAMEMAAEILKKYESDKEIKDAKMKKFKAKIIDKKNEPDLFV